MKTVLWLVAFVVLLALVVAGVAVAWVIAQVLQAFGDSSPGVVLPILWA